MIPTRPNDRDESVSEPIADLPLFTDEEIQAASGSEASQEKKADKAEKPEVRVEATDDAVAERGESAAEPAAKAPASKAPRIEKKAVQAKAVQESLLPPDEPSSSGSHIGELDFGEAYADDDIGEAPSSSSTVTESPERDSTGPVQGDDPGLFELDQTGPIESEVSEASATANSSEQAPLARRFQAAALDAAAMLAVLITLVGGASLLGAPSGLSALPFYLPTWILFSLLYHVIPLLFWGSTPGMAYAGLVTRAASGGPLTVDQALRRWLAGGVTALLLGLPGLMALSGGSLADRASRTITRQVV